MIEAPTAGLTVDPNVLNQATQLRFRVFHEAICYSSEVDEAALQSIPWPASWPSQARDALQPQTLIESDNPLFAKVVQEVSGGDLRLVPPWIAAKELVRHACNTIQKNGETTLYGPGRSIRGLDVNGALAASGSGPPTISSACLNAAGIPARPVIGRAKIARARSGCWSGANSIFPRQAGFPSTRRVAARAADTGRSGRLDRVRHDVRPQPTCPAGLRLRSRQRAGRLRLLRDLGLEPTGVDGLRHQPWQGRIGEQRLRLDAWNTPSVLHFEIVSHGRVDPAR